MRQKTSLAPTTTHISIALQLFLSHFLATGCAFGIFYELVRSGVQLPSPVLLALIGGGLAGLLLTANLQYSLYLLTLTMARFALHVPVNVLHSGWRWPLNALFTQLQKLNEQIGDYAQKERLTLEFREQALRQASEVAAREERNRIARDLHDSIKQQIFSISVSAAAAKAHMRGDSESAQEALVDIQRSTKEAQVEMRALLQQLRLSPLENTNLNEALRTQAQALGYRTGAQVNVEIAELPAEDRLPPGAHETLFRMVQEAFANIARHARATTIWLKLYQKDNTLHIEIRDDGQGFDLKTVQKGMGLGNLQERAKELHGVMQIQSAPGKGTTLDATIPLIEALPSPAEQERRQLEIRRAVEQANWGFQLADTAIPATAVFMLLNVPPIVPILACATIIYAYLQASYFKARVTILTGSESVESGVLRRSESLLYILLLSFIMFIIGYFYSKLNLWSLPFGSLGLCILFALLIGLIMITLRRRYLSTERYYHLLHQPQASWELDQFRRTIMRRIRLFLIVVVSNVLFNRWTLVFPPVQPYHWFAYCVLLGLVLWGISLFIDYLQIAHLRQELASVDVAGASS